MSSSLHHITRRRKNALALLSSRSFGKYTGDEIESMKEEKKTLQHRIDHGAHSSDWYRKQTRKSLEKKIVVQETEQGLIA